MLSARDLRNIICPFRDIGIDRNLFVSVKESLYGVPIDILSFERVSTSFPQVAQFLVDHGLADPPPREIQIRPACVRFQDRVIGVDYTKNNCTILPLLEVWDMLDVHLLSVGQYTFVVDIDGGRFRIRYKRHQLPGEIGSKHICMVDEKTEYLVLAGELSIEPTFESRVNLESGTFMAVRMSVLRGTLIRTVYDIWSDRVDENWLGWEECRTLWWIPLLQAIIPGAHFTSSPLLVPVPTPITLPTLVELYKKDPWAMREFATCNDCLKYSPTNHQPLNVPWDPDHHHSIRDYCKQQIMDILPNFVVGEVLGYGGNAMVWQGLLRLGQRPVALKVALSSAARNTLRSELRTLEAIGDHPGIVYPINTTVLQAKRGFIGILVLPYYADGHLSEKMCWCAERVDRLVREISGALVACHAAGYLHLDVSMANILVDGDRFGLTDFGSSLPLDDPESKWTGPFGARHETDTPFESPLIFDRVAQTTMVDWHSLFFVVYKVVHHRLPWETMRDPVRVAELKHELINRRGEIDGIPRSLLRQLHGNER
jgi:hypothetical protein